MRLAVLFSLAAILFILSQGAYYGINYQICKGTNAKVDGSFLATLLETGSITALFVAWRSITEDRLVSSSLFLLTAANLAPALQLGCKHFFLNLFPFVSMPFFLASVAHSSPLLISRESRTWTNRAASQDYTIQSSSYLM